MPSMVIRRTQTILDKIADGQIYNRHIADNTIIGSAKLVSRSIGSVTIGSIIPTKGVAQRAIGAGVISGSAKLLGSSVGKYQAPFALMGNINLQKILYGTGVFVLNTKGTVPVAISFASPTPFQTSCDFVMPMFGDQTNFGIPAKVDIRGHWPVARTRSGFTWYMYVASAAGTPANVYYSYLAIGRS